MYIQITDKCNMLCTHCGWSCTAQGIFMEDDIYLECCKLAQDRGDHIFLGGGEPTLHPNFIKFLGLAILYNGCNDLRHGLFTNGSNEDLTLNLLHAAKAGAIFCEVSLDDFHEYDMVSPKVRDLANQYRMTRYIDTPIAIGRAKKLSYASRKNECICDDLFISPNGEVYTCGCKKKMIGHIKDKDKIEKYLNEQDNYQLHGVS